MVLLPTCWISLDKSLVWGQYHFLIWKIVDYINLDIENKTMLHLQIRETRDSGTVIARETPGKKDELELCLNMNIINFMEGKSKRIAGRNTVHTKAWIK